MNRLTWLLVAVCCGCGGSKTPDDGPGPSGRVAIQCPEGQVLRGVSADGTPSCTAAAAVLPACPAGQWLISTGEGYACSAVPVPSAGAGLVQEGTTLSVDPAYVQAQVGGPYLPLSGGTVQGNLSLDSSMASGAGSELLLRNTAGGWGASVGLGFSTYDSAGPSARLDAFDSNYSAELVFSSRNQGAESNPLVERLRIGSNGRVRVSGTLAAASLEATSVTASGVVQANQFVGSASGLTGVVRTTGTSAQRIVMGLLNAEGTAFIGEGYSGEVRTDEYGNVYYRLNFSPAFAGVPVFTANAFGTAPSLVMIKAFHRSYAEFYCFGLNGTARTCASLFIAIG